MTTPDPTRDLSRLPTVEKYLAALPHDLDSYPQCEMRTDFARDSMHEFPGLLAMPEVPSAIRDLLERSSEGEWQPAVHALVHQRILRDLLFRGDDEQYMAHAFEGCARLFATPIYRALFLLLSPNLLVLGAHNRWSTFCRGVRFDTLGGDQHCHRARFVYPTNLYDRFACNLVASALSAALTAAGARGVDYSLNTRSDTETDLQLRWLSTQSRIRRL